MCQAGARPDAVLFVDRLPEAIENRCHAVARFASTGCSSSANAVSRIDRLSAAAGVALRVHRHHFAEVRPVQEMSCHGKTPHVSAVYTLIRVFVPKVVAAGLGAWLVLTPIGAILCSAECEEAASARPAATEHACHGAHQSASSTSINGVHDCSRHDRDVAVLSSGRSFVPSAHHYSTVAAVLPAPPPVVRFASSQSLSPPGERPSRRSALAPLRI